MFLPLFLLIGFVLLTICSGFYVFWVGCVRRKEFPWLEDAIEKTPYGKYRDAIRSSDRFLKQEQAEDIWIDSHDGLKLHAHWIPAKDPVGTVILAHGYRSTKLVDFSVVYRMYHDWGLNLLVPDQRAHGQSQGRFITFGVNESKDMKGWIGWHNQQNQNQPIMLSGLSMGASTMLFLADQPLAPNVKGIIADCGFSSPWDIVSAVFRKVTHLPPYPSVWVANLFAKALAGFDLRARDTMSILPHSCVPVLLVHGTEDDFVPCSMTKEAYKVCNEPKKLLLVEGAGHGVSFLVEPERYMETVKEFFFICMGVRL